jgi:hypothetical protein
MEATRRGPVAVVGAGILACSGEVRWAAGPRAAGRRGGRHREPDGRLAPFRPGRFAERASRVLLEVDSALRVRPRQRPSL